ncbi:hypothetical protein QBC45DRAFT_392082 [Copromyces sp. CBS 386.78]|nr:hypothetical protein QBC45DRAFT_392082 [Copromyces sp. CBS 386.78]
MGNGTYWKITGEFNPLLRQKQAVRVESRRSNAFVETKRAVPPPPVFQPPVWEAYVQEISGAEDQTVYNLVTAYIQFAFFAFSWASMMERYNSLESGIATLGQTRPIIPTLHGKLAFHEHAPYLSTTLAKPSPKR